MLTTRQCLLVLISSVITACGAEAASGRADPSLAGVGREGASSGAMSRAEQAPTPLPAAYVYPVSPRTNTPVNPSDPRRVVSPQVPAPISYGQTIHGQLRHGDAALADGALADDYVFIGSAGDNIVAEMHGGELLQPPGGHLDSFLYLLRDGIELMRDDDGAGNLDSRISTRLPASGVYILRCTTYSSGLREGDYTLVLQRAGGEGG